MKCKQLREALEAAKREMWAGARPYWTREDFERWAIIEQINAALDKAAKPVCSTGAAAMALRKIKPLYDKFNVDAINAETFGHGVFDLLSDDLFAAIEKATTP